MDSFAIQKIDFIFGCNNIRDAGFGFPVALHLSFNRRACISACGRRPLTRRPRAHFPAARSEMRIDGRTRPASGRGRSVYLSAAHIWEHAAFIFITGGWQSLTQEAELIRKPVLHTAAGGGGGGGIQTEMWRSAPCWRGRGKPSSGRRPRGAEIIYSDCKCFVSFFLSFF